MHMKYFLFLFLALPAFAYENCEPARTISVRGDGEVKVKPDLAKITMQVWTKEKDAQSAQAKNAEEMARVNKILRDQFKIEAKDIQTSNFQVNPEYRYEQNGKQVFLGYRVEHGLAITLRDLSKVGKVLDAVIKGSESKGISLGGMNFDSDKRKEYELQALDVGMKEAFARAESLARSAKRKVKGVMRISESSVNYRPFQPMVAMAKSMNAEAAMVGTDVSPGEIVVSSQVAVDFEIE